MGAVRRPVPVQPIAGLLAASAALLAEARHALAAAIAPVGLASAAVEWTQSEYYRGEMGGEIWRQYLALDALMAPDELADLKRLTNALEDRWRGGRGKLSGRGSRPDRSPPPAANPAGAAPRHPTAP